MLGLMSRIRVECWLNERKLYRSTVGTLYCGLLSWSHPFRVGSPLWASGWFTGLPVYWKRKHIGEAVVRALFQGPFVNLSLAPIWLVVRVGSSVEFTPGESLL